MLFNSLEFFVFLAAVLVVQAALAPTPRKVALLAASYLFYAAWDWRFLSLIALSTGLDFVVGAALGRDPGTQPEAAPPGRRRRLLLATSLVVNLGMLGFFKYAGFFATELAELLAPIGIRPTPFVVSVVLPVGISFYTFQTLSYTIDIYRGRLRPTQSLLDFALFVAFFPQLIAGPIERASRLLPQIESIRRPSSVEFSSGFRLVLWGIFKKVVIADRLARVVDFVYASGTEPTGPEIWLATYAFAFQIYCDFSGYTDVARGVARMLGFDLMVNFRLPYLARNPAEFWRRWHISLSTWLRDYLYISLGGNRRGTFATYRNLMITMLLGGLWHGANWTFLLWGAFHGGLLVGHRALSSTLYRVAPASDIGAWLWAWSSRLLVFHLVCIGWLIFRADSVAHATTLLVRGFTSVSPGAAAQWWMPLCILLLPLMAYQYWQTRLDELEPIESAAGVIRYLVPSMFLFAIILLGEDFGAPFLYFQF